MEGNLSGRSGWEVVSEVVEQLAQHLLELHRRRDFFLAPGVDHLLERLQRWSGERTGAHHPCRQCAAQGLAALAQVLQLARE